MCVFWLSHCSHFRVPSTSRERQPSQTSALMGPIMGLPAHGRIIGDIARGFLRAWMAVMTRYSCWCFTGHLRPQFAQLCTPDTHRTTDHPSFNAPTLCWRYWAVVDDRIWKWRRWEDLNSGRDSCAWGVSDRWWVVMWKVLEGLGESMVVIRSKSDDLCGAPLEGMRELNRQSPMTFSKSFIESFCSRLASRVSLAKCWINCVCALLRIYYEYICEL